MALRFLLVGLVASLGYEAPGGLDVSSLARMGRDWVNARMADASRLRAEAERAFAGATDCERSDEPVPAPVAEVAPAPLDLAFDAVVDGMAKEFSADLASIEVARPANEAVAEVLPDSELPDVACLDPDPGASEIEALAVPSLELAPSGAPSIEPVPRVERISKALRLTRQAIDAWASLIRPSTVRLADDDRAGNGDETP